MVSRLEVVHHYLEKLICVAFEIADFEKSRKAQDTLRFSQLGFFVSIQ
jgi:hypothetical protein